MPSINGSEKTICQNCCTQTTKLNLARHMKSFSAGTLFRTQRPTFSTKSQTNLNYQISKKHSAPKPDFEKKFLGFYYLRQHKETKHGLHDRTTNFYPANALNEVDDANIKDEFRSCEHFPYIQKLNERDTKF